jgi:hypothetical protein
MKYFFKPLLASIFLFLAIFSCGTRISHAQEDCLNDPIYNTNWNAEVTTGARLRDIPCMTTSVVITTLPVGEVVKVIAETDGYYKIQRTDGTVGWVGQWLITATDKSFTLTSATTATANEPLYDIVGHKNETQIRELFKLGIISGNPDGSFKPDSPLNRAELVKILIRATVKDFDTLSSGYNNECFPDIAKDQWYTPYVCYAKEKNIVSGYGDNTFKPARDISRAEAVKVIVNSFGIQISSPATQNYFSDTTLSDWFAPYLQPAYEVLILEEKAGEAFRPNENILRGSVSYIIYKAYLFSNGSF